MVNLPLGDYTLRDPRASGKQLVNCFAVPLDTDSQVGQSVNPDGKQPVTLQRMHGVSWVASLSAPGPNDLNVRGFGQMAGQQYVVIGTSLYVLEEDSTLNIIPGSIGQIPNTTIVGASNFVRMTNNTECLLILIPGTNLAWTYAPAGGGFQKLNASFFLALGAADCWFVDSYIVFLAAGGIVPGEPADEPYSDIEGSSYTFYNDDGLQVSGVNQITFTSAASFTREFGTDLFVGGCIDHREVLLFGTKTSEGYVNVGATVGTPFQAAPDSFIHAGCHYLCGYTIAMQDEAPIWVANDLTVRRRDGQTPVKISTPAIDQFLTTANLQGCYALTPTVDGHPLWVLTVPNASRSVAYDCLTQKWFDLESPVNSIGYWRPLCHTVWRGNQLLGDSQGPVIGRLDPTSFIDSYPLYIGQSPNSSQVLFCAFTVQGVYDGNNRITHRRLELVVTAGGTPNLRSNPYTLVTPVAYAPQVELWVSDNGRVFESFTDPVTLGGEGDYDTRAVWFNLGQARFRQYQFRITEPTQMFAVDIQADLKGGKW